MGDAACPKCGRASAASEDACPRCGLLTANFAAFAATVALEPPELADAWEAAVAAWEEDAPHERLLTLATSLGLLPQLARRYRDRKEDQRSARQLQKIAALVESAARIEGQKAGSPRTSRLLWAAGYAVAGIVLLISLWFVARVFFRK
jgi:hypothetical protein